MRRPPMMNSALGFRHFTHFNHGQFNPDGRFRRFRHFNEIIFIGNFASSWWWAPWWVWNWGYPSAPSAYYPSEYSGYGSEYGNYNYGAGPLSYDYGYGYPLGSYYGSFYGGTTNENDDESAVRNVLAEYAVSWNSHDTAALGRLFAENSDYVNIDGDHWRGTQEIVQRQGELFRNRLKTAARRLTSVQVRFSAPDVALVDATWNVTGWRRPSGEAVPGLTETSAITMTKTNGKWQITSLQNTESEDSTK